MKIAHKIFFDPATGRLKSFWRGQLFLFDTPPAPTHSTRQGSKLLVILAFLELIVRPLTNYAAKRFGFVQYDWWTLAQMITFTVLVCGLVKCFAKIPMSQLGLYSWARWSKTEKFYFLQILPICIIMFSYFTSAELERLWKHPNLWQFGVFTFLSKIIWGWYQEALYRGLLQTELVRRWGASRGIVAGNLIFTFGPLHFYHFFQAQRHPAHLWIFAAIFATGLLFAILFHRSGNLWIIGIMHGIGDWFIDGLSDISRLAR